MNPVHPAIRALLEPFPIDVADAIANEAEHTAVLAREDGADTKHAQGRLVRLLGRHTTPAEQLAVERCVRVHLAADEPS